jgi:hypothetical protein
MHVDHNFFGRFMTVFNDVVLPTDKQRATQVIVYRARPDRDVEVQREGYGSWMFATCPDHHDASTTSPRIYDTIYAFRQAASQSERLSAGALKLT